MNPPPTPTELLAKSPPLASILITNYNYGSYLAASINSALTQTYQNSEVLVVDDGSTDQSREVIATYGDRLRPVLKENGGQTSAFNAGFQKSRGEIILFLDADDLLLPTAVEKAVALFQTGNVAQVHWPLWEIDAQDRRTGQMRPNKPLPSGNLRDRVLTEGPDSCLHPPTSGNAWARRFLEQVFPLPEWEREFNFGSACADACLSAMAPLFGEIRTVLEPQAYYRLHGRNDYAGMALTTKLRRDYLQYRYRCEALSRCCRQLGLEADPGRWKANNSYYLWMQRLHSMLQTVNQAIPRGSVFILVDEDQWKPYLEAAGHSPVSFLEKNGVYWGPPADDEAAIRDLEQARENGATFIVIGWPAFWWLDHYRTFQRYLRANFSCPVESDCAIIFALGRRTRTPGGDTKEQS